MKPQIGQIWKFTNRNPRIPLIEYYLIVDCKPRPKKWILYNIRTGESDMDYDDQFQMNYIWNFIQ